MKPARNTPKLHTLKKPLISNKTLRISSIKNFPGVFWQPTNSFENFTTLQAFNNYLAGIVKFYNKRQIKLTKIIAKIFLKIHNKYRKRKEKRKQK